MGTDDYVILCINCDILRLMSKSITVFVTAGEPVLTELASEIKILRKEATLHCIKKSAENLWPTGSHAFETIITNTHIPNNCVLILPKLTTKYLIFHFIPYT
jgi:hypothetical protein